MTELYARDLMSDQVLTVRDHAPMKEAAAFLTEQEISGAPVLDSAGSLVGVVSLSDVARSIESAGRLGGEALVRDIMTPLAFTVDEDTPMAQIARMMVDNHIHRVVVTRHEKLLGVVTSIDLLDQVMEPA